ncbi:hypothetical protein NE237_025101 [Protea cynaroides]|uniref:Preprotein translocase subunit SECE1 n=1 Tax=Protea cynaroides TaxID=273540 RepID=A0A9Q0H2E4_9MAGN|nr:hypothetical protein NE237_025101 [Protea cynaroides]
MAIQSSSLSLRYMVSSTRSSTHGSHPDLSIFRRPAIASHGSLSLRSRSMRTTGSRGSHHHLHLINAIEEEKSEMSETDSSSAGSGDPKPSVPVTENEMKEIKEAIKARMEREGERGDLWRGVAEETREIEWPAFAKVVGTTGVVLGVIAGSSVVLLTVNAVFAELSDRVFAGRGVQDFFG